MDLLVQDIITLIERIIDKKIGEIQQNLMQIIQNNLINDQQQIKEFEIQTQQKLLQHDNILNLIMEQLTQQKEQESLYRELSNNSLTSSRIRTKHSISQSLHSLTEQSNYEKCGVCFEIVESEKLIMTSCGHFYHQQCLQKKVKQQIEVQSFPNGVCVSKNSSNKLCYGTIKLKECHFTTDFERIQKRSIENQVNKLQNKFSICPSHRSKICEYFFNIDITSPSIHVCPKCQIIFCLSCLKQVGLDHRCQEQINKKISGKICPNCKKYQKVEKSIINLKCDQCNKILY